MGTRLYPVAKEARFTNDQARLLAELAEADESNQQHIIRIAVEKLSLAYRRRGPAALRLQQRGRLQRKAKASTTAQVGGEPIEAK